MLFVWFLIVGLAFFIVISVPIGFSIALSSLLVLIPAETLSSWLLVQRMYAGLNSFPLLAIPLFLLAGLLMNSTGVTDKLIQLSYTLVGSIKGGLAHVNVVVSMFFAGISGSSTADTAGIGSILIPAMVKKGYSKEFSVAVTAASSTMGVIIPPSIMAVIYAATTNISIGALFLAGIIPGILIGLSQMIISYIYAVKYNYPSEKKASIKELFIALKNGFLPLLSPFIIIGGIIGGIFTATEAAAVAVAYSLFLGFFVYRSLTLKKLRESLFQAARLSALSIFCISTAAVYGYIIAYYRIPEFIGNFVSSLTSNGTLILLINVLIFLIVGTFMDAAPAIIILMPILAPIAYNAGVHPVHIGVIVVVTLALGLITPPYGLCLLIASEIANIKFEKAFKTVLLFFVVMVCVVVFCVFFPNIILMIPKYFLPKYM